MNMRFEFATATKIVFGAGTLREAGAIAKEFGKRVLVVAGRDPETRRAIAENSSRIRCERGNLFRRRRTGNFHD